MSNFGERLKKLIKSKNLTQQQIADLLFVNKSSVSRYESNSQLPETPQLQKLADYFEVSLDYLLGRSNETHVLVSNENKNSKINLEEMIFDFEKGLENVIMKNGEKLDERTKELFKQSLRNVYDFIAPEDKKD